MLPYIEYSIVDGRKLRTIHRVGDFVVTPYGKGRFVYYFVDGFERRWLVNEKHPLYKVPINSEDI